MVEDVAVEMTAGSAALTAEALQLDARDLEETADEVLAEAEGTGALTGRADRVEAAADASRAMADLTGDLSAATETMVGDVDTGVTAATDAAVATARQGLADVGRTAARSAEEILADAGSGLAGLGHRVAGIGSGLSDMSLDVAGVGEDLAGGLDPGDPQTVATAAGAAGLAASIAAGAEVVRSSDSLVADTASMVKSILGQARSEVDVLRAGVRATGAEVADGLRAEAVAAGALLATGAATRVTSADPGTDGRDGAPTPTMAPGSSEDPAGASEGAVDPSATGLAGVPATISPPPAIAPPPSATPRAAASKASTSAEPPPRPTGFTLAPPPAAQQRVLAESRGLESDTLHPTGPDAGAQASS